MACWSIQRIKFSVQRHFARARALARPESAAAIHASMSDGWKEVGGASLPIQIFAPKDKMSIQFSFNKMALKGQNPTPEIKFPPTFEDTTKTFRPPREF
jgi:hypothetical protein